MDRGRRLPLLQFAWGFAPRSLTLPPFLPYVSLYPLPDDRPICAGWIGAATAAGVESFEISPALGLLLSVKDSSELDNVKRAAILTNKVRPRHGRCFPHRFRSRGKFVSSLTTTRTEEYPRLLIRPYGG